MAPIFLFFLLVSLAGLFFLGRYTLQLRTASARIIAESTAERGRYEQGLNKENHRKEFFRVALAEVRKEIEKFGLNVSWTMTAKANEFRASLVTEKKIADNPTEQERWISRQRRIGLEADDEDELVGALAEDE